MKDQNDKSEPKLCPFRPDTGIQYNPSGQNIGSWVMFSECLEDKCAMWREYTPEDLYRELQQQRLGLRHARAGELTPGHCGLAGK